MTTANAVTAGLDDDRMGAKPGTLDDASHPERDRAAIIFPSTARLAKPNFDDVSHKIHPFRRAMVRTNFEGLLATSSGKGQRAIAIAS